MEVVEGATALEAALEVEETQGPAGAGEGHRQHRPAAPGRVLVAGLRGHGHHPAHGLARLQGRGEERPAGHQAPGPGHRPGHREAPAGPGGDHAGHVGGERPHGPAHRLGEDRRLVGGLGEAPGELEDRRHRRRGLRRRLVEADRAVVHHQRPAGEPRRHEIQGGLEDQERRPHPHPVAGDQGGRGGDALAVDPGPVPAPQVRDPDRRLVHGEVGVAPAHPLVDDPDPARRGAPGLGVEVEDVADARVGALDGEEHRHRPDATPRPT